MIESCHGFSKFVYAECQQQIEDKKRMKESSLKIQELTNWKKSRISDRRLKKTLLCLQSYLIFEGTALCTFLAF